MHKLPEVNEVCECVKKVCIKSAFYLSANAAQQVHSTLATAKDEMHTMLKKVDKFCYLGNTLDADGRSAGLVTSKSNILQLLVTFTKK